MSPSKTLGVLWSRLASFNPSRKTAVSLQVMSDLHLELLEDYMQFSIPRKAPLLLLAGDIGRLSQYDKYARFLKHQCLVFEHVYLVLGNHEFYALSRERGLQCASDLCNDQELHGKLTILNRARVDLSKTVTLLGCTLHSQISDDARDIVKQKVADFRRIDGWGVDGHNFEHNLDVQWLRDEVAKVAREEPQRVIIIATHHAPSHHNTSDPKHASNPWKSAFATNVVEKDMPSWRGVENVSYWIFGHTHWCSSFDALGVHFISNQRGYAVGSRQTEESYLTRFRNLSLWSKGTEAAKFDALQCIEIP